MRIGDECAARATRGPITRLKALKFPYPLLAPRLVLGCCVGLPSSSQKRVVTRDRNSVKRPIGFTGFFRLGSTYGRGFLSFDSIKA